MSQPPRLAVVEDNPGLLADLIEFLALRGFSAHGFASAEAFFLSWPAMPFDLLLLDVALPGVSGLDIAQRVRGSGSNVGIVILTALDSDQDHATGLGMGADIFLSKRSSLDVIEAACHSVLRRLGSPAPTSSPAQSWRLLAPRWQLAAPNGTSLDITHAEVALLTALLEKPGEAVTREALLARLGKAETLSSLRNLDNTVSRLKRKVQSVCGVELPVRPSYGKGYTFTGRGEMG